MNTYAVVVINKDNYTESGYSVNVTNDINKAKEYLKSLYDRCIESVTQDKTMEITKHIIDDDCTEAEIEWISSKSSIIFSSMIFISNADTI